MKVFISGPMTGYPDDNYPAFHAAEAELLKWGASSVESPARNIRQDSWEAYMQLSVGQMLGCKVVATLPGWRKSVGATAEIALAKLVGIMVPDVEDTPAQLFAHLSVLLRDREAPCA